MTKGGKARGQYSGPSFQQMRGLRNEIGRVERIEDLKSTNSVRDYSVNVYFGAKGLQL